MWVTLFWPIIMSFTLSGRSPSTLGIKQKNMIDDCRNPPPLLRKNRQDPPKESKTKHNSCPYELSKIDELIINI